MEGIKETAGLLPPRALHSSPARTTGGLVDAHSTDGRAVLGDAYAPIDTAQSGLAKRGDLSPSLASPRGPQRRPSLGHGVPSMQASPAGLRRSLADVTRRHLMTAWVVLSATMLPSPAATLREISRDVPAEMVDLAHELADRHRDPERDGVALDRRRAPLTFHVVRLAAWLATSDVRGAHHAEVQHAVLRAIFSLVTQPQRLSAVA